MLAARRPRAGAITKAADQGDELEANKAMLRRITRTLDDPSTAPRDLASLTRQARELMDKIAGLQTAERRNVQFQESADETFDGV